MSNKLRESLMKKVRHRCEEIRSDPERPRTWIYREAFIPMRSPHKQRKKFFKALNSIFQQLVSEGVLTRLHPGRSHNGYDFSPKMWEVRTKTGAPR